MTANILITMIMMLTIVVLVVKNICHPSIAMIMSSVIAAFLMGYGIGDIETFAASGIQKIVSVLCMVLLAVAYFGVLHDQKIFEVIVDAIVKRIGGNRFLIIFSTAIISFITQLDGSGATTALCTIPPLKPVYEKTHLRKESLLLIEGIASGTLTMIPWAPSFVATCAYAGIDVYETFQWILPTMIFAIALVFVYCLLIFLKERKTVNSVSPTGEKAEEIVEQKTLKCSKKMAVFNIGLTLLLMGVLLSGVMNPTLAFAIGFSVIVLANYRTVGEQVNYIREQSRSVINMVFSMIGVGVMLGVNDGTGAMEDFAQWIIQGNENIMPHLPVIAAVASILLTLLTADAKLAIIMPLIATTVLPFGFDKIQVIGAIYSAGCVGACVNMFSPTAYLSLGLAEVSMKDHLRANFIPIYLFSVCITLFNVLTGHLPL